MPTESDARSGDRWNIAVKRSAGWSKMLRRCRLIIAEGTLRCFGQVVDGRFRRWAGGKARWSIESRWSRCRLGRWDEGSHLNTWQSKSIVQQRCCVW